MAGEAEAARSQEPLDGIALGDGRQRRAAADAARPESSRRAYELCAQVKRADQEVRELRERERQEERDDRDLVHERGGPEEPGQAAPAGGGQRESAEGHR